MIPFAPAPVVYRYAVGDRASYAAKLDFDNGGAGIAVRETVATEVLAVLPDGSARLRVRFLDRARSGSAGGGLRRNTEGSFRLDPYGRASEVKGFEPDGVLLAYALRLPPRPLEVGRSTPLDEAAAYDLPGGSVAATLESLAPGRAVFTYRVRAASGPQTLSRRVVVDPARGRLLSSRVEAKGGVGVVVTLERKEPR